MEILIEMFENGGPVMWPLLAASVFGLAIILERMLVFAYWMESFSRVVRVLGPLFRMGNWTKAERWCRRHGPYSIIARFYLQQREQPKEIREDILRREGSLILTNLEKRLRWLAVLAQISTLLGLLATFHVMVVRFHQGEQATGGQMTAADFSAAIWESLLTTMFGLLIAIPCSAVFQLLEGRVDLTGKQMGILVSYLDEWSREAERNVVEEEPAAVVPAANGAKRVTVDKVTSER